MACSGGCGGKKKASAGPAGYNPTAQPRLRTNDRGMYLLAGDEYLCEPYHGAYPGSTVFVVGLGTDDERLFTVGNRVPAYNYAVSVKQPLLHVSVSQLCHDSVVALLNA